MLMILVGILIATGIIAGVTALEQGRYITNPLSSTVTSSTTVTSVTSINSPLPTGVLAAQITDPPDTPTAPAGTTHIYIAYSDIEARTLDQNSNYVWFTIAKAGTIDLMSVLNVGQTLGSAKVSSGIYDQARFDITNATVTFAGKNYTASIPLNQIVIQLSNGGALVKPNASAGFVIDVTPTVLALSNGGRLVFQIVTATQGVPIPEASWTGALAVTGSTIQNINNQSWWKGPTPIGDNLFEEVPAQIYPTTMVIVLNNTGTTSITISALNILAAAPQSAQTGANVSTTTIVSTITTVTTITEVITNTGNSKGETGPLPAASQPATSNSSQVTVATFLILTNGSVIQPGPNSAPIPANQVGLTIKPNQVVVLLYLGFINTLNSPNPPYSPQNIIGGQQYTIQIVTPFGASIEFNATASYTS